MVVRHFTIVTTN